MKSRARALASLLLLAACRSLQPPAVMPADGEPLELGLTRYPAEAEPLALRTAAGHELQALFVPAGRDAPVVLHLLDAGTACTGMGTDLGEVSAQLADLGFASLVFDWAGVGLSGGSRSAANLATDAAAAWAEAVHRAGGNERRVLVRGISLGALAAAGLVEAGARPAAAIWIAPVFPDSVIVRFLETTRRGFLAWVAGWLFRPVTEADPERALALGVPTLVLTSRRDELLSDDERGRLQRATRDSCGTLRYVESEHLLLAARARWLYPEELRVFRETFVPARAERLEHVLAALPAELVARFPPGSDERARLGELVEWHALTSPEWIAAAALAGSDVESAARLLWLLRRRPYASASFEDLVAALTLEDPAGPLPVEAIEACSVAGDLARRYGGLLFVLGPESLVAKAWRRDEYPTFSTFQEIGGGLHASASDEPDHLFDYLRARVHTDADAVRHYVRVVMRARRVPERLVPRADGGWDLEIRGEDGAWTLLDLSRPLT